MNHGSGEQPQALRIAYLFMRYPMGSQPFAISDVKALEAFGHRVDTYSLSGFDTGHDMLLQTYEIEPGARSHVSLRTLTAPFLPWNWKRAARLLAFLIRHHRDWSTTSKALVLGPRIVEVAAELARTKPDIVHAFWGHFPSLLMPLVAAERPSTVRSMFLGAYDLTSHLAPFSKPVSNVCQTVWTHSEDNLAALSNLGIPASKTAVVHRGIPLDLADKPKPTREPYRICTAANLQKEKNVDLILRTFAELVETIPEATLTIAGDGEEREALISLCQSLELGDRVTFTGRLPRSELFQEMARSRVFLFLSTKVSERLPNVVKEAMLAECHCIVTETPGIRELVEPGRTGEIVEDLDPRAIALRLARAMRDDTISMGQAAAEVIRNRFSSEASMVHYVESWTSVLSSPKNLD